MNTPEHDEQVALFRWAALNENRLPELKNMFAVQNGGQRHKAVAAKLKAEGVKAGVPDIFLAFPKIYHSGAFFAGLFIEMKAGKNRTTQSQKEWIVGLKNAGYMVAVCYGWEQAVQEIERYLG